MIGNRKSGSPAEIFVCTVVDYTKELAMDLVIREFAYKNAVPFDLPMVELKERPSVTYSLLLAKGTFPGLNYNKPLLYIAKVETTATWYASLKLNNTSPDSSLLGYAFFEKRALDILITSDKIENEIF